VLHPRPIHLLGKDYDAVALGVTTLIGLGGALLAVWLATPLPWLFGSVMAVGLAAFFGVKIGGEPVQFPVKARFFFVPIIGVAIGASMTPEILREIPRWWPSLAALLVFIPAAHLGGYIFFRRIGKLDSKTAWFSSMPGGLIEALAMGEQHGADMRMLNLLQFLRLIVCILIVPSAFMILEGGAVGSASGVQLDAGRALTITDGIILIASGVLGLVIGQKIRLPAALITGPILMSGAAHLLGLTQAAPPGWMVSMTQLVVGLTLGIRFAGLDRREVGLGMMLTAFSVTIALGLAVIIGTVLSGLVGERIEAVVLAFAPGGVVEMSLIAISLEISVIYVALHHVARILLAVAFGTIGYSKFFKPSRQDTPQP
jgi:membrane AbrB-like protein